VNTVFLAHAQQDRDYVSKLAAFLEFGCDVRCYVDAGRIGDGEDIVAKADQGSWADAVVLLLSKDSWPERIARVRWDPLLLDLPLVCILLSECAFPELLRRRDFFDADNCNAARKLKRWLWQRKRDPGEPARAEFSNDLEEIYCALADRAGSMVADGVSAQRFSEEAAGDFEAVLWVPCHGRSVVQASGNLGAQLGMVLDGQSKENCERIREVLAQRRCLLVLDSPDEKTRSALTPGGRTSTLVTAEPVRTIETPQTFEYARELVSKRRLAEAYDLLYQLLDTVHEPDFSARELAWICDHWGRVEEGNRLREQCHLPFTRQMSLFDAD
jgi:hypothetical protein